MKSIIPIVFLFTLAACSQKFETAGPYRDIVIVQGVLQAADTAHYISIRKTFAGNTESAYSIAQVPDSHYFKDIQAVIIESDAQQILNEIPCHLTDLNAEGYPKEEGIFFAAPNYVYKFKHPLNDSNKYRLIVTNKTSGRKDSSELFMIVSGNGATRKASHLRIINFASTHEDAVFKLQSGMPKNATLARGNLKFHYVDSNTQTGERSFKTTHLQFDEVVEKEGKKTSLNIYCYDIYNTLYVNIGPAPANIVRLMDSCEVWAINAAPELLYDTKIAEYLNQFITSDMSKPVYTNMKGGNAYGIISSVAIYGNDNAAIDNATMDTLMHGPLTRKLNFVGRTGY